jgi:hypothetical protein
MGRVLLIVALFFTALTTTAQAAGSWSAPAPLAPDFAGRGISCPTTTFCAAVDLFGRISTFDGASWSQPSARNGAGFWAISCPSATFCQAVGSSGRVLTYDGETWVQTATATSSKLASVSCTSATFCTAVTDADGALTFDGVSWSKVTSLAADLRLTAVSCASATFCMAVGGTSGYNWGRTFTFDGSGWGEAVATTEGMDSVSCPAPGRCIGVSPSNAYAYTAGAWDAGANLTDIYGSLRSVSCASPTACAVADTQGFVFSFAGGAWGPGVRADPNPPSDPRQPIAISCATPAFCVTIASVGTSVTGSGPTWSEPGRVGGALSSVSCVSATFCAAADSSGRAITIDGTAASPAISKVDTLPHAISCASPVFCVAAGSSGFVGYDGIGWHQRVPIDSGFTTVSCASERYCVAFGAFTGMYEWRPGSGWSARPGPTLVSEVSCPTESFCAAVDVVGWAFTYDGERWSDPVTLTYSGYNSPAVSCATASFCVALDREGNAHRYDGTSWNGAEQVDSAGYLTSVSCPTTTFCAAVGQGRASLFDGTRWSTPKLIDSDLLITMRISCPSPAFCAAVSSSGDLVTYAEPAPTPTATPTATASPTATATASPVPTATATAPPAATATSAATAQPSPVASLRAAKAAKRAVVATVRCAGGRCPVTFTLLARRRTVGSAKLTLAAGTSRTVRVKLNAAGRRQLAKAKRLRVKLRVATPQRVIATKTLTLR